MKYLIILLTIFSLNSFAQTSQKMLNDNVSTIPNSISIDSPDSYKAEDVSGYEGRNKNRAEENLTSQVKSGATVSRNIQTKSSIKSSQLENLESTAGELVQKLEDDRVKKSKKHKDAFESAKKSLQLTYDTVLDVDVSKLGSERDPEIQNAFKCLDVEACNKDPNRAKGIKDNRAIKKSCSETERLRWNGAVWSCVGIFEELSPVSCSDDQYQKSLNGGVACIDYIYEWGSSGYTSCDSSGNKISVIKCFKKKKPDDKNVSVVADSKCLGKKPEAVKEQCTSSWKVSGWSGCSKTCGGGVQTRNVYCPLGYKCIGAKPSTSQSCNTQSCEECKFQKGRYEWIEGEDNESGATWEIYRWNGRSVNPYSSGVTYRKGSYVTVSGNSHGSLVTNYYYKICRK